MRVREGLITAAVIVLVVLAFVLGGATSHEAVTRTVTFTPTHAVEAVIIQPELVNEVCILVRTNQTSTAYLLQGAITDEATSTTTTESFIATNTITIYKNATIISNGSTCTEVNPYYGTVAQTATCGPCA